MRGKVKAAMSAQEYQIEKISLMPKVLESFARLEDQADIVLVEGAGSPAEVNLRSFDIANMGFALAANVPVALIGDIDRGGVIAQLVGTHALLEPEECALIKGYIVNKFRGDLSLFSDALDIIRGHAAWRCFGVLPWFDRIRELPAEDSVAPLLATSGKREVHAAQSPCRCCRISRISAVSIHCAPSRACR